VVQQREAVERVGGGAAFPLQFISPPVPLVFEKNAVDRLVEWLKW
jgi:hypothetical protein